VCGIRHEHPKNQLHRESLGRRKKRKEKEFSLEHRQKNGGQENVFSDSSGEPPRGSGGGASG
jgi:hypothetical protein